MTEEEKSQAEEQPQITTIGQWYATPNPIDEWYATASIDRRFVVDSLKAPIGDDETLNNARDAAVGVLFRRNPGGWLAIDAELRYLVIMQVKVPYVPFLEPKKSRISKMRDLAATVLNHYHTLATFSENR